jgi:selenocysteine lyase/cysteine desulfurase
MDAAFQAFRKAFPAYDSTRVLDALRETEYARLDRQGHVYLDYTGGSLYPESLVRDHMALLKDSVFGNPHSKNLTSMAMTELVELRRPWYSGGTITFSSVLGDGRYLTPGAAGFEDGTVNYLSLPAVELGLRLIESVGIETIQARVKCLTGWLIEQLMALRHSNGRPVIQLYGPTNTHQRGGTVQVNFFDPDGRMLDCKVVEQMANAKRISLRAGCHCNPGAREIALGFTREDLVVCFADQDRLTFEQFLKVIEGKTTGALRASLGLVSNFADVYAYVQFAKTFIDRPASADELEYSVRLEAVGTL